MNWGIALFTAIEQSQRYINFKKERWSMHTVCYCLPEIRSGI